MAPSCALGTHQQQSSTSHQAKRESGLLSRLFGTLRTSIRQSSSTRRNGAGSACGSTAIVSPPANPYHPGGVGCMATATSQHAKQAVGENYCGSVPVFNYQTDINAKYIFDRELGKGGNGVVRVVKHRETGEEFACKSIRKVLTDASDIKKKGHLESIRREVQVLQKLRGSLNIVKLEDVFEDDECVHIVMELCRGGELWHRIGDRHYSERTVASFMRAVLRTLAQCHAQHILHRDIKPGNFMLLGDDERAPLKAIDFGLAAPFDPEHLPRTDLGLEGTPWYMAPETLRGEWLPASDLWAAGVMAFQLLSGRFPFDDKKNVYAPAITAIWRSVLNDPLDLSKPWWADISPEAKDFCRLLLARDPAARPSAKEALKHPWLRGDSAERSTGKRLGQNVVARIQRFASGSALQRTVLQAIAAELLAHPHLLRQQAGGGGGGGEGEGEGEAEGCAFSAAGRALVTAPDSACLAPLMSQLRLDRGGAVLSEEQLGEALRRMGFRLAPSEVSRLMAQVDLEGSGAVDRAAFAASQMDWRHLQQDRAELWLQLAEKAFRSLDTDGSGVLEVGELLAALRARLPADEVGAALEQALAEAGQQGALGGQQGEAAAGGGGREGIDFEGFVKLLKIGSVDSLDLYDDRMSSRSGGSGHPASAASSLDRSLAGSSVRGALRTGDWSRHGVAARQGSSGGLLYDNSVHSGNGSSKGSSGAFAMVFADADKSQKQAAQPAHVPGGSIVFRFDTDRVPGGSKQPAVAASRGGGGGGGGGGSGGGGKENSAPPVQKAAAPAPAASGGMVWRFDVGSPAARSPPPPTPVWRFDVGGSRASGKSPTAAPAPAAVATVSSFEAGAGARSSTGSGSGSGSGSDAGGRVSGLISSLGRQGGYYDRRMHGSDLYRNVALMGAAGAAGVGAGALRLESVAE